MDTLANPETLVIGTSLAAFVTGFALGVYAIRGWVLVSPELADERRRNLHDPVESDESDVELPDHAALDHAPNWANGFEADRRDGLRVRNSNNDAAGGGKKNKKNKAAAKAAEGTLVDTSSAVAAVDSNEECKLVLVVRTDLGMTKGTVLFLPFPPPPPTTHPQLTPPVPHETGKIAAQCSHATLACYKTISSRASSSPQTPSPAQQILRRWERHGQAKIATQVRSEAELLSLLEAARALGVVAEVVQDAGRTQIDPGSLTVLGVGPAPRSLVDRVTGGLKLL